MKHRALHRRYGRANVGDGPRPPKFKLGDLVERAGYPTQRGEVSFIGPYDAFIGCYRYRVLEPSGTRLWWNETSMKRRAR